MRHDRSPGLSRIALFGVVLAAVGICGPVARGRPADPSHDALIEQCRDASPKVRADAFSQVEESRELVDRAFPELIKGLGDADPSCRHAAIGALGRTLRHRKEAAAALTKFLQGIRPKDADRKSDAISAVRSLGALGTVAEPAVPTLAKIVESDSDSLLASHVVTALKYIGRAGARPLGDVAKSGGLNADDALYALGDLNENAADCLPDLIGLLESEEADIRSAAMRALGKIGRRAQPAVPHLVARWNDSETKPAAVKAIGEIGPAAASAAPQLVEALGDPKTFVEAVRALVYVGCFHEEGTQVALRVRIQEAAARIAAGDEQSAKEDVRRLVEISRFVHESVDTGLETLLPTAERRRRDQIARAMAAVDPENADLLKCLREGLGSKDEEIRRDAVEVAGLLGRFAAPLVAELAELVDDSGANTRGMAITALGVLGSEARAAIPQLRALLRLETAGVLLALSKIDGRMAQEGAERMFDQIDQQGKPFVGQIILLGPAVSSRRQDASLVTIGWIEGLLDRRDLFLEAWFALAPMAAIEPESREVDAILEQELTVPGRQLLAAGSLVIRGRAGADAKAMVRANLGMFREMACDSSNWGLVVDSRVWGLRVVEGLGPDAADLIPTLRNLVKHRNGQIAAAARRALEKVEGPGESP
jgi:HEAT repeat protein